MQYELDLTAYRCPLPLLMVKKALTQLAVGDELVVWLDRQNGSGDIDAFCQRHNYPQEKTENGDKIRLTIRKTA